MVAHSTYGNAYKWIFLAMTVFILLEYFYGSIIEQKTWKLLNTENNDMTTTKSKYLNVANLLIPKNMTKYRNTTHAHTHNLTSAQASNVSDSRPYCPVIPPGLVGPVPIRTAPIPFVYDMEREFSWLRAGGRYTPHQCISRNLVAVIVPYRSRASQLLLFLHHIHPILKRQQLDYGIFVVEQYGRGPFNRAKLMNLGFVEASKQYKYECFVFHDVDLLPEDDRNLYTCPEQPRHMSVAIDVFNYRLPYATIFGGVSAMTKEQFRTVNGFSNEFWGWGGEDDDMSNRVRHFKYHISRYPSNIARYKMLSHNKETANPKRFETLYEGKKRFNTDGLNSLNYTVKMIHQKKLYTWIYADLHGKESRHDNKTS